MDLPLTVTASASLTGGARARFHVRVDVDGQAPVGELIDALALACAGGRPAAAWLARTGRPLERTGDTGRADLLAGDEVVLTAPGQQPADRAAAPPAPAAAEWELLVVGGPDAGERLALPPGTYQIGRDAGPGRLVLSDARTSRRHAEVTVPAPAGAAGAVGHPVTVGDLGSANGSFLDGGALTGPTPWPPGALLAVGSTRIALRPAKPAGALASLAAAGDGTLGFRRPPRVRQQPPPAEIRLPQPPQPPGRRRLPLSASLVPVLMGGVMALVMGPVMLLFALMGPVMAVMTMFEDKRSGRREYLAARGRFADAMDSLDTAVAQRHAALLADRRAAAPSTAELAERAEGRHAALWERRPGDDDFLALRLGAADLPSRLRLSAVDADADSAEARRVAALLGRFATDPDAPVDADVRALGALGVCGSPAASTSLLRALTLQAVALTSPRDLALVALVPAGDAAAWDWLKWLPHTLPLVAGVPGARTVAAAEPDIRALFGVLDDLISTRRLAAQRNPGAASSGFSPAVLLLMPGPVPVPGPALSRVLTEGPDVGVYAIIGAATAEQLPGECRAIVRAEEDPIASSVTVTASGDVISPLRCETIGPARAAAAGRALAPLRDTSAAAAAGELPRQVLLLDVLGMSEPSPQAVLDRWAGARRGGDLGAPIGMGQAGVVRLDLRRDGPHGLAAGTTGAGKSELLQSLVAALAACHPASELTFILVDYKGGAAFADCVGLPHTVGFFTDLDPHLARRALVSLNAELRRREHILAASGAKDLLDLERRHPETAPASLFIVFDEFAFLKKEVPEFVAGVIDIAQRGRSLGVHLMLATQRPSGVVDDNIRANTNLRIALRIADEADSNDVIDRPDAARIPKSLPGRAFLRIGREVITVQSAYGGARSAHGPTRTPTVIRPLALEPGLSGPVAAAGAGGDDAAVPTDLQRLVAAIRTAHQVAGIADAPRPWLDPLPELVPLGHIVAAGADRGETELAAVIGLSDLPDEQAQRPHAVDLAATGHLAVYGASGSGKTTALRTLSVALAQRLGPKDLHLYGLDFAGGGLLPLQALPHCGAVITPDEAERVDGLFALLDREVARRRAELARVAASSLAEYRAAGGDLPYLVVLLDGYAAFHQTYLSIDHGELPERLARLAGDGRAVGIHLVLTADRRGAIGSALSGVIGGRLVLRMAEADEYASLGLPTSLGQAALPPGRGFTAAGREVQVAVVGDEPSGAGQASAVAEIGRRLAADLDAAGGEAAGGDAAGGDAAGGRAESRGPARIAPLADEVPRSSLPPAQPGGLVIPIGLSGITGIASTVDLGDTPVFAAIGPDRSGRSTALATLTTALLQAAPDLPAYLIAPRRSPLVDLPGWLGIGRGPDNASATVADAAQALEAALAAAETAAAGGPESAAPRLLVVVDDADELMDSPAATALSALLRRGRDAGLVLLVAAQTHVVHRAFGGLLTDIRKPKSGALLGPDVEVDGELFGVRLPRRKSRRFPPGRCYLVRRGEIDYVQIAR